MGADTYPDPHLPPLLPARLPLMRPKQGRILCGVCKGISLHLGIKVSWVRLFMLALIFAFGAGIVAYIFLWIYVPAGDPIAAAQQLYYDPQAQPLARPNAGIAGPANQSEEPTSSDSGLSEVLHNAPKPALLAGVGALLLALALSFSLTGMPRRLVFPTILLASSLAIAWFHFGGDQRRVWTLAASGALILAALASYVFPTFPADEAWQMMLLALIVIAAVAVILTPWASSILARLSTERAQKEREEERADMAAHLHDGVLQTLALIQLHADDPQAVFTLARGQERDLRNWLYQERTPSDRSVSSGLQSIAAQIEDAHGKPIDVVTVGDAHPSAQTDALLDATQQALINAVTHGAEPISVYCEAGKGKVEVFVRDHGAGFDTKAVPPDRLGIRESIIGRLERRGGTVEIVSRPNWGTEVRMHMPISAASDQAQQDSRGQQTQAKSAQRAGAQ
ncbi:ATP-binding protein [Bombiscardovia apis]|nr:PspC domain-containing protein [Bombiscardovia apis]